jgi:hypothetical protein
MAKMVIRIRGRRVNIICVPERKKRYERESEEDTGCDTMEYRDKAT